MKTAPQNTTGKIRRTAGITSVILAFALCAPARAQEPTRTPDSAITAAEQAARAWFALLADANYAAGWEQASRYFREHVTREQWIVNAGRLERQFQRATRRKLVEARWLQDEPPLPHAEYVVLRWLTALDEGRQVGERIIMSHEPDGSWRPATYDLFPNVDGNPIVVRDPSRRDTTSHAPSRRQNITGPGKP